MDKQFDIPISCSRRGAPGRLLAGEDKQPHRLHILLSHGRPAAVQQCPWVAQPLAACSVGGIDTSHGIRGAATRATSGNYSAMVELPAHGHCNHGTAAAHCHIAIGRKCIGSTIALPTTATLLPQKKPIPLLQVGLQHRLLHKQCSSDRVPSAPTPPACTCINQVVSLKCLVEQQQKPVCQQGVKAMSAPHIHHWSGLARLHSAGIQAARLRRDGCSGSKGFAQHSSSSNPSKPQLCERLPKVMQVLRKKYNSYK